MKDICIVIRKGKWSNLTLATVKFDKYGQDLNTPYVLCDDWEDGWALAVNKGYTKLLLVDHGLVFLDIQEFMSRLENYPHKGLIGHITDPLNGDPFYLHPQTTFIDTEYFDSEDLDTLDHLSPYPIRSDKNIHHDYTPLWLRPGRTEPIQQQSDLFGAKLIVTQLEQNDLVSNWSDQMRSLKKYLYDDEYAHKWISEQQYQFDIAENHLWVLNNEPTYLANGTVISPASGLFWIKNLFNTDVERIYLLDISQTQIDFVTKLLNEWDGNNYGKFCLDYMFKNKVRHFNLDDPKLTSEEKISLIKEQRFIDYVNSRITVDTSDWTAVKHKVVQIENVDMVKRLPTLVSEIDGPISVWASNILNYRYTLIKNSPSEYDLFLDTVSNSRITLL